MRTTVTIDPENETRLKAIMRAKKIGLKQALNEALRRGLGASKKSRKYRVKNQSLGLRHGIQITLGLADELEDRELLRKMELKK